MWMSYQHSAELTVALVALWALLRLAPVGRYRLIGRPLLAAAAAEGALVAALYTTWRYAGSLHTARAGGAYDRAREIARIQNWLHLPSEVHSEHYLLAHPALATAANGYYALSHGSILAVVMIWAFLRDRAVYRRWRTGLAGLTGISLLLHFVPVAPPRLMPALGFVDEARHFGQSVYAPFGSGAFDQLAAMPSLHVGWALVAAGCWWQATRSRWRWAGVLLALTTFVVVAVTANHWWLDGVVAGLLLAAVLAVAEGWAQLRASVRWPALVVGPAGPVPAPGKRAAGLEARHPDDQPRQQDEPVVARQ